MIVFIITTILNKNMSTVFCALTILLSIFIVKERNIINTNKLFLYTSIAFIIQ